MQVPRLRVPHPRPLLPWVGDHAPHVILTNAHPSLRRTHSRRRRSRTDVRDRSGKARSPVVVLERAARIGKKISSPVEAAATSPTSIAGRKTSSRPTRISRSRRWRGTRRRLHRAGGEASHSYHEKTLGQLFCDRSAQDVVDLLERNAARRTFVVPEPRVQGSLDARQEFAFVW